jgi:hypothetical protein
MVAYPRNDGLPSTLNLEFIGCILWCLACWAAIAYALADYV